MERMHRHDLDEIAALAEGTLQDTTRARELVESCADCRREYEAQLLAISALTSAGQPTMTELERAALHRDLWTSLTTEGGHKAAKPTPWWYRWGYAAAGLFVVVGLVGVISQGGAQDAATEAVEQVFEGDTGGADGADTVETTRLDAGELAGEQPPAIDEEDAPATLDFASLADRALSAPLPDSSDAATFSSSEVEERATACLEQAGLTGLTLLGEITEQTEFLLAVESIEELGPDTVVTFVSFATCEVLHIED